MIEPIPAVGDEAVVGLGDKIARVRIDAVDVGPITAFSLSHEGADGQLTAKARIETGVREISGTITAFWTDPAGWSPTNLAIGERFFLRLIRATMTKRRFRRWRGKYRAAARKLRREGTSP
jgi:hypothetical protein